MIFGFAVSAAVGLLCIWFGRMIAGMQKTALLQKYLCENVKPEDLSAFSVLTGLGIMAVGAGVLLSGVLLFLLQSRKGIALFPLIAGTVCGVLLILAAQLKFNRRNR